jgi:hypothetical protein
MPRWLANLQSPAHVIARPRIRLDSQQEHAIALNSG